MTAAQAFGVAQVIGKQAQTQAQYNWAIATAYLKPQAALASAQATLASDQAQPQSYFSFVSPRIVAQPQDGGTAASVNRFLDNLTNGGWSNLLTSPLFGQVLDAVDGTFAGFADAITNHPQCP